MKRLKKVWAMLLCLCMAITLLPTTVFAAKIESPEKVNGRFYSDYASNTVNSTVTGSEGAGTASNFGGMTNNSDTFTVTYKTNADVEMGTLIYEVGGENTLPTASELSSNFNSFIQRAKQKGDVYVPNDGSLWYEDKEFTAPATFPDGQKDENYTLYCKLTVQSISAGIVSNGAENKSYADVGGTIQPYLAVSGYSTTGRNDGYEGTKAIFERKNAEGNWVEVPEEYYTDKSGNTWPNMIYFSSVSDSGTYRLKDVRYTATDNDGNVLYYVNAENTPKDEYTVKIAPMQLSITGVTAQDRNCDGTDKVQLSGGTLEGVLYGDEVSFALGTGTVADKIAGSGKPVTTNITLTGEKAGNYTLKQPENITVTISHAEDNIGWRFDENGHWKACVCGEKMNAGNHTGGTATCTEQAACEVCNQKYGSLIAHKLTPTGKAEATCTKNGKEAYYTCKTCHNHFSDAAGQNKIADLESWGIIEAGHKAEKVDRVEPAATESGNIEYWYCPVCDKYFANEDLTEEITKEETVLAATDETADAPQTGDNSNPTLWVVLLLLAFGGMTGITLYARKCKTN